MWLGWYYMVNSQFDEAEPILEDTVDGMRRILSDVDWNLLEAISRLAWVYWNQGRLLYSMLLSLCYFRQINIYGILTCIAFSKRHV